MGLSFLFSRFSFLFCLLSFVFFLFSLSFSPFSKQAKQFSLSSFSHVGKKKRKKKVSQSGHSEASCPKHTPLVRRGSVDRKRCFFGLVWKDMREIYFQLKKRICPPSARIENRKGNFFSFLFFSFLFFSFLFLFFSFLFFSFSMKMKNEIQQPNRH